jgi:hypothetical protein
MVSGQRSSPLQYFYLKYFSINNKCAMRVVDVLMKKSWKKKIGKKKNLVDFSFT